MSFWNSRVTGIIKSQETSGITEGTDIVGRGNTVPTKDNPNAWAGIPATAPDTGSEFNAPKDEAGPIPSVKKRGGNPYAGMGDF